MTNSCAAVAYMPHSSCHYSTKYWSIVRSLVNSHEGEDVKCVCVHVIPFVFLPSFLPTVQMLPHTLLFHLNFSILFYIRRRAGMKGKRVTSRHDSELRGEGGGGGVCVSSGGYGATSQLSKVSYSSYCCWCVIYSLRKRRSRRTKSQVRAREKSVNCYTLTAR